MPKTKSHSISKGGYTYYITEITRDDGGKRYIAKRSDSNDKIGNIFTTKKNLKEHYKTIKKEIDQLF